MALQNNSIMPIKEYLSKRLYIPTYQREYAWEETELEDFWADLEASVSDKDYHFFGQIVIHNENDSKLFIIDGQQRSITSVIFLRVLSKFYSENELIKDTDDADAMVQDIASLIGRKTRNSNDLHLVLGNDDKDYFITNIQTGYPNPVNKQKKTSQERMRKAFLFFENKINERISNIDDEVDLLDELDLISHTFIDNFKVLYMEATKLNEAFIIFETLNARGKDLETADLLKNYLFSKANDVKEAEKNWTEMISALDGIDPTKFIRHLWNSRQDFTREKDLYKRIIHVISTPRLSKYFSIQMASFAPAYHDLSSPSDCDYYTDERLKASLVALKDLKATTFYPIVLALEANNYSEADIADVVSTIETLVFRNFAIGGLVSNAAEVAFAKTAKRIFDQKLVDKHAIQAEIQENMMPDDQFAQQFKTWKAKNTTYDKTAVRYIYRKIHSYLCPTSEVVIDNNKVHIEHIMPQNPEHWTEISEEVHTEYLWRLGNLSLLDATLNKEMQNKPFDFKRSFFASSQIRPNEEIALQTSWGPDEIDARQAELATYALSIWKRV